MKVFHIGGSKGADLPDYLRGSRLVAVGIIGKSPLGSANKATPLLTKVQQEEPLIECHWDERSEVVYLHLMSAFDTKLLTQLVAKLGSEDEDDSTEDSVDGVEIARKRGDWLVAANDFAIETSRSIFLLLNICHIIIISSPTPHLDLSYLQIMKALSNLRMELGGALSGAVTRAGVAGEWGTHGRPCCPRVLFYMHAPPAALTGQPHRLKTLRHCLEDQIYLILRKARIITNVCAKSLFAIPKNEEFVYINPSRAVGARDLSTLVRGLVARCGAGLPSQPPTDDGLHHFLQTHIDLALGAGFDDNVGKFASSSLYFEVPTAENWRLATAALSELVLWDHELPAWSVLWDCLATDVRFSAARCAKVLPLAQAAYTEGLPPHYSTQHHLQKVALAVGVMDTMARGPLCATERARLEAACEAVWRARRLCEALSLTNNPCIKPKHGSEDEDSHSSGVRYVSVCNCGRTKLTREDPYSVRRANCGFYETAAADCHACPALVSVPFPVFQPSTSSYRAASLKWSGREEADSPEAEAPAWSQSPSPAEALSLAEQSDAPAPTPVPADYQLLPVKSDCKDKTVVRQPSTTEYLPGMLHTESPPGLLPAFPSWSLVCLGASSLYSHNVGLAEHLHPGFLPHTNLLLAWDCAVRLEQVSAWRQAQAASRGRSTKPPAPHQLTVKIFLGFEYECPRGHRFMMASPDSVVSGPPAGKDAGADLANTDMPVYVHCPCRGSKTMVAQLMRVHIVSPKAPVHVTLNPRVQPVLYGPTFVPGCEAPVKLSGSAYWLLRLPYIYSDERQVYPRPPAPLASHAAGKLFAGMIGVTD